MGILLFPIFAGIVYFIKTLVDRKNESRALNTARYSESDDIYEIKEKKEEMNWIIEDIKNNINTLREEIYASQGEGAWEDMDQREKDITRFYANRPETRATGHQETALHNEQIRIMNENINKFLVIYREKEKIITEKDKVIDEKNVVMHTLQQRLAASEQKIKQLMKVYQQEQNKDAIIQEKTRIISSLQYRLQEVENKFKKIALLHKSITEKEQIKDNVITEKNAFISSLQSKLADIERKLQNMVAMNEENKERILDKRFLDIDKEIEAEKRKNWILMLLFIFFLLVGIGGCIFVYTTYIRTVTAYTI